MYTEHFGFQEDPFGVSPDPRFLYLGPAHHEAFAALMYGVKMRRGFMSLTGEPGTGKTTLLYALLEKLESGLRTVFLPGTDLTFKQRLQFILESLGTRPGGGTVLSLTRQLQDFLAEEWRSGSNVVLIFDEAQNLSVREMEDIRLLTNFEVPQAKLLQVILVGQPQLKAKLSLPELAQLKQRITVNMNLRALTLSETAEYIEHRLHCTDWNKPLHTLFSRPILAAVYEASRGIPRLINAVCHNALLIAYAENKVRVDMAMIKEAAQELDLAETVNHVPGQAFWESERPGHRKSLLAEEAFEPEARVGQDVSPAPSEPDFDSLEFLSDGLIEPPASPPGPVQEIAVADSGDPVDEWPQVELPLLTPDGAHPEATVIEAASDRFGPQLMESEVMTNEAPYLEFFSAEGSYSSAVPADGESIPAHGDECVPPLIGDDEMTDSPVAEAVPELVPVITPGSEGLPGDITFAVSKPKVNGQYRNGQGPGPRFVSPVMKEVGLKPAPSRPVSKPAVIVTRSWLSYQPVGTSMDQMLAELESYAELVEARTGSSGVVPVVALTPPANEGVRGAQLGEFFSEADRPSGPLAALEELPVDVEEDPSQHHPPFPSSILGLESLGTLPPPRAREVNEWLTPILSGQEVRQTIEGAPWSKAQIFAGAVFLALFALCVGIVGGIALDHYFNLKQRLGPSTSTLRLPRPQAEEIQPSGEPTLRWALTSDLSTLLSAASVQTHPIPQVETVVRPSLVMGPQEAVIRKGDDLSRLLRREYGYLNSRLVDTVKAANPRVVDWNVLLVGQKIMLPIDPEAEGSTARPGS